MSKWVQRASAVFRLDLLEESGARKGTTASTTTSIDVQSKVDRDDFSGGRRAGAAERAHRWNGKEKTRQERTDATAEAKEQFHRISGGDLLGEDEKHLLPKLPAAMIIPDGRSDIDAQRSAMSGMGFGGGACILLTMMVLVFTIERIFKL